MRHIDQIYSCKEGFAWYEMLNLSHLAADRYINWGIENARYAYRRYDFLVWC